MKAKVLTPWVRDGNSNRCKLAQDYVVSWSDITAQPERNIPPDQNMYVVEIETDAATFALIEADTNYNVLLTDESFHEVYSNSEFGQLVAYMAKNGMTAQAARQVIGNNPNGRTRMEIADELRIWLKNRPKT
jgi:hypothetical protein